MSSSGSQAKAETHERILQAALACFRRKGYNHTTMDDIVAESGLSKGTLYWHFESKDDLLTAVFTSTFEAFGEDAISDIICYETAAEKLRAMAHGAADFSESLIGYFSLFIEFWISSERREETSHIWYDLLEQYQRVLAAIIEEGIQNGEFRPVDAESLAWAFLATYDGLAAYAEFVPDLDLQCISQTFVDTILDGLKKGP
jgi:AcrR family transcriptional regulator